MINSRSLYSLVSFSILATALWCLAGLGGSLAQDISGGSSAEIASAADVESKSGKGIFTTPKNVAHNTKRPEKKVVTHHVNVARAKPTPTSGGKETADTGDTRPHPTATPNPVLTAEDFDKQGDD